MSKLHLVFGGRVTAPQTLDFDEKTIEVVGIFPNYASAEKAWRAAAQRTVDDAEMKFVVVHLHRLLEPDPALQAGGKPTLDECDLADLVPAVARGHGHFDLVADHPADQRAAERRVVADPPGLGIGLGLADDLVRHRLVVLVLQRDGRAEHHLVARQVLGIDDLGATQFVLDVGDRRLYLALTLLGGMVFGVFRQIAMRARFLDRLDDLGALLFQPAQIRGELLIALLQHRHLLDGRHTPKALRKNLVPKRPVGPPALSLVYVGINCASANDKTAAAGLQVSVSRGRRSPLPPRPPRARA